MTLYIENDLEFDYKKNDLKMKNQKLTLLSREGLVRNRVHRSIEDKS